MTWEPSEDQKAKIYVKLVKTRVLDGKERSEAHKIVREKMNVKRAQAYNILKFLESKGMIQISRAKVLSL